MSTKCHIVILLKMKLGNDKFSEPGIVVLEQG